MMLAKFAKMPRLVWSQVRLLSTGKKQDQNKKEVPREDTMTDEQIMEEDLGKKLYAMVEGSDFDKKMDEMFNKMLE